MGAMCVQVEVNSTARIVIDGGSLTSPNERDKMGNDCMYVELFNNFLHVDAK